MLRKVLRSLLIMVMAAMLSITTVYGAAFEKEVIKSETENMQLKSDKTLEPISMKVSSSIISMTEPKIVELEVKFDYKPEMANLEWTFGDKPFNQWKKWVGGNDGSYSGEPFINFIEPPSIEGNIVKAKVKFDLIYQKYNNNTKQYEYTKDLSSRPARTLYPSLIGTYNLTVRDTLTGLGASSALKLNVYDSYRTYDELKPAIDEIFSKAKPGRYLEHQIIGKSTEGRDFHLLILAKDKASVINYQYGITPFMLYYPQGLQKLIKEGTLTSYKVPIFINNIHPDEAPGIDAQLEALERLTAEDKITYKTLDDNNNEIEITLNIDELLNNVIFIMNLTENPDGRFYNTRQNINGFDVNRDNGYQTQVESQIVVEQIAKWNPISFLDLHGFVSGFLIEPCTPPHDPNYEYDLLMDGMIEQAHAMGKAGVSNTRYESYLIPLKDYGYGWDDGTPAYTATYAMHHGALGHTIEIPELNQDSVDAAMYAIFASAKYVTDNKERLFNNQLEYFKRGIEGIDSKEVDKWLVNAEGVEVGRARADQTNFFPEYYILPIDKNLQKNSLEVYKIVEYLLRNGIKVDKTSKEVKVEDVTYPAGTFLINMKQAKRGYANAVLSEGFDVSDFQDMYAEIVMNFPVLRGFDVYKTWTKYAFTGKTEPVYSVKIPTTELPGDSKEYIIRNSNNDTIKAVNKLLAQGKEVKILLESGKDYEKGDYLVSKSDIISIKNDYLLEVIGFSGEAKTKAIIQPKIFLNTSSKQSKYVLKELGFTVVEKETESNVLFDDNGSGSISSIMSGKPYIGIGAGALNFVTKQGLVKGLEWKQTGKYHEGLLKTKVEKNDLVTAGYEATEYLYVIDGSYITAVPENAEILLTVSEDADFFAAGWMPGNKNISGKVLAVKYELEKTSVTLFANTLTNKAHPQHSYRLLANAIFNTVKE